MNSKNVLNLTSVTKLVLAGGLLFFFGCGQDKGDVELGKDAGASQVRSAVGEPQSSSIQSAGLAAPVRLQAGGEWIDTEVGHAAPYLADMNGDGKRDLLVGQFGDGKLKICWNVGTNHNPDYEAPVYFKAGGEIASVETG